MAGDLVNQAKPRIKPKIRDKSKRWNFDKSKTKNKHKTPKKDKRVSAKAIRSKKNVKGIRMYSKEVKIDG